MKVVLRAATVRTICAYPALLLLIPSSSAQTAQEARRRFLDMYQLTSMPIPAERFVYQLDRSAHSAKVPFHNYSAESPAYRVHSSILGEARMYLEMQPTGRPSGNKVAAPRPLSRSSAESAIRKLTFPRGTPEGLTPRFRWTQKDVVMESYKDGYIVWGGSDARGRTDSAGRFTSISISPHFRTFEGSGKSITLEGCLRRLTAAERQGVKEPTIRWEVKGPNSKVYQLRLMYLRAGSVSNQPERIITRAAIDGKLISDAPVPSVGIRRNRKGP